MKRCFCTIFICVVFLLLDGNIFIDTVLGIAESTDNGGSNSIAVHLLGDNASGVSVGMVSLGNVRDTHLAFRDSKGASHVFNYDFIGGGFEYLNHETWVAGILASRGTVNFPDRIGVACGADVYCGKAQKNNSIAFINFYKVLEGLIGTLDCDVVMTDFCLFEVADGQSSWTLLCDYFAYTYDVVFAFPAGNDNNIAVFGDSYNGITTGGLILTDAANQYDYRTVGTDSGQGMTGDGRRKPDICMPSQGQTIPDGVGDDAWITWSSNKGETSFAVPHCAGEAAILCGAANKTTSLEDSHSEVIKAVIINSTFPNINDKQNLTTNPSVLENVWHCQRGYGRGDCLRGYELITSDKMLTNQSTMNHKGWAYNKLYVGQVNTYRIYVPRNCRLISTLVWNRRVHWFDSNQNNTINSDELTGYLANLDLEIYEPSNSVAIFSESKCGLNANDNVEKCDILAAKEGYYTIRIRNKSSNGESAAYGFAFEVLEPIKGDIGVADSVVDLQDMETLTENWLLEDRDINLYGKEKINFADFAELMNCWLNYDSRYYPYN